MNEIIDPKGGEDIMLSQLAKYVDLDKYNVNIINSKCRKELIDLDKRNILWQHVPANQQVVQGIRDKYFNRMIDAYVYVSHWQHEKFRYMHQIPLENAYIIKNAIEPIEFIEKPKAKIKLIFTSMPYRGLDVMLKSFEILNRDDVELDVYSSNEIYGKEYVEYEGDKYEEIFDRARSMKNVNYIGYAPHEEVIKAFQSAHIFAYPCIFEETACLSMIEAGAAGCNLVTTNIGGLPETGSVFANLVPIQSDEDTLVNSFAEALDKTINNYWSDSNQVFIKEQSDFYNKNYNWNVRKDEWIKLLDSLPEIE
jgi:glycosyltransferase involved in cell wall biosynthesis